MKKGILALIFMVLVMISVQGTVFASKSDEKSYVVSIRTADAVDAGTDGKVYIRFNGTDESTSYHLLDKFLYKDFQRSCTDSYVIKDVDVGEVDSIDIVLDGGITVAWQMEWITFKDNTYKFNKKIQLPQDATSNMAARLSLTLGDDYTFKQDWTIPSKMAVSDSEKADTSMGEIAIETASAISNPSAMILAFCGIMIVSSATAALVFAHNKRKKAILHLSQIKKR